MASKGQWWGDAPWALCAASHQAPAQNRGWAVNTLILSLQVPSYKSVVTEWAVEM